MSVTPMRPTQNSMRIDALETDLRRAESSIRHLYVSLAVVTCILAIAIVCVALFTTGYLPL